MKNDPEYHKHILAILNNQTMSQQAMEQARLLEFQSGWISLIWIMLTSLILEMITRTGEHLFYKELKFYY